MSSNFLFLPTNTNTQLLYNKIKNSINNCIAFNTLYLRKLKSTNNKIIAKIYIKECNKNLFKNLKSEQVSSGKSIKIPRSRMNYVSEYINFLQNSGYTSFLKKSLLTHEHNDLATLTVKINPVLKKIKIRQCKKLKIHQILLKSFFKSQIGLPKNYRLIQESIDKIYSWYRKRGYKWIEIKTISSKESSEVEVLIEEGIIDKVNIICKTKKSKKKEDLNKLNSLIVEKLKIVPKMTLNLKTLESGIKFFEKQKIVNNLSYKVDNANKGLIIKIKYSLSNNKIAYSYKTTIFKWSKIKKLQQMKKFANFLPNFCKNNETVKSVKKVYHANNEYSWLEITQEYIWKSMEKTKIYLRMSAKLPLSEIKLSNSKIIRNLTNEWISCKYNALGYYKYAHKYKYPQVINLNCYLYKKSNLRRVIGFMINQVESSVGEHSHIIHEIIGKKDKKHIIHLNTCIYKILKRDFCKSNTKTKNKMTKENCISILIKFIYRKLETGEKYENKRCTLLHSSELSSSFYIKNLKTKNLRGHACKDINFTYKPIISLPPIESSIKKSYFLLTIKTDLFSAIKSLSDLKLCGENNNLTNICNKSNDMGNYSIHIVHAEYKICILKHIEVYAFSAYTKSLSYKIIDFHNPQTRKNLYKNIFKAGIGFKAYMPLKKFSNIYLEYNIDQKNKKNFRISKRLIIY
uniref:POTRA domain-containing protein n=1 Tax=Melanthalia intermedia TaxID=172989 RepID=A0A345UAN4_9FLOR|nr:hypothetical protein [Melanthalia intermedia]AXI97520.1 hypothetical protein [Melanthalia intermedia]